jgi:hypothetical protein
MDRAHAKAVGRNRHLASRVIAVALLVTAAVGIVATAQQPETASPAGPGGADRMRFRTRLNDGISDTIVILPAIADKKPHGPCPAGTGLFSILPEGLRVLFHRPRAELSFALEELVSRDRRNVALVFSAPTCRMTLKVEKEVRRGDEWVRVAPVEPSIANRR